MIHLIGGYIDDQLAGGLETGDDLLSLGLIFYGLETDNGDLHAN